MPFHAYADRNGVIGIGPFVPNGKLPIATSHDSRELRDKVEGACRLAYDGKTLLVPGIPEADSDDAALEALLRFRERITDRLD